MERILLAIDGSENSHRALMKAKEIGNAFNSEITIIHVIDDVENLPYSRMGPVIGSLKEILEEESSQILKNAVEDFKDYKYKVDTLILKGNPGQEIIKTAEKGNFDLIVIGSRGLGAVSRFMLGGISNKVINHAKTSVIVVK